MSTIGKKIKKIRIKKKISQDRLSKLSDLSLNTIVNIETGSNDNPKIDTLKRIARGLDINIS